MSDAAGNQADDFEDDNAGNRISGGTAKAALEYVARSIVDDPESVVIEAQENGNNTTLTLFCAPDDKGKVIGKRGRVAMSIRTVMRAIGARDEQNVSVDIADD